MPTARQTCWRVWPPMRAANAWGLTTMEYNSTRDSGVSVLSAEAITRGISADGGLFVPENVPWLSYEEIRKLADNDYVTRAADIIGRFLTDFTPGELMECISRAYTRDKFETDSITPLYEMEKGVYMLELWHGPTCAFKDMALQLLPHLLTVARRKTGESGTVVILVATSGDTGKAALEGFQDVEGTRVVVFYPENGVSPMQKLQMTTQRGNNVSVCAIRGNFDDAQNGVKAVFADPELARRLAGAGMAFSSANSINWGRLVPQIVYYVSAYCDLVKNERISCGEHVNIVVPTGNFGNILAAYYAKKMGIPVNKLICASNANHVLTDFIRTGVYDRNRPFYTTISPSMDILISSNLERLLYDLTGCDARAVAEQMARLRDAGRYEVDETVRRSLGELFWAGSCDDGGTRATIREIYRAHSYVCDPHTAVAIRVYEQYRRETGDASPTVIASTASPFKFAPDVLEAIEGRPPQGRCRELLDRLGGLMFTQPPRQLSELLELPVRFGAACAKDGVAQAVTEILGL